jgi:DNA/RNA-binding domain of Phe-tRNA-synthetase-like protein
VWYTGTMITKALKDMLTRVEAWPETAQDEAVATLQALEEELMTPMR